MFAIVGKMTETASNEKQRFTCPECARSYSRRHDMERHIDIAHTLSDEKPYKCELCKFVFSSKEKLRTHKDEHEQFDFLQFKCEICDKGFRSKNSWKRHMRAHIDPTPYACQVCNRKFGREHDMHRHTLRMHSGERTYQCDLCSSKFAWFSDLTIHKRRHNVMRKTNKLKEGKITSRNTVSRKSKKNLHVSANKGDKPGTGFLACKVCNQSFATFSSLQLHTCDLEISAEDEEINMVENGRGLNTASVCVGYSEATLALQAHAYCAKSSSSENHAGEGKNSRVKDDDNDQMDDENNQMDDENNQMDDDNNQMDDNSNQMDDDSNQMDDYSNQMDDDSNQHVSGNIAFGNNCSINFSSGSDLVLRSERALAITSSASSPTIKEQKENRQTYILTNKNIVMENTVAPDFCEFETESESRVHGSNAKGGNCLDGDSVLNESANKTRSSSQSEFLNSNFEALQAIEPNLEGLTSINRQNEVDKTMETKTENFMCKICLNAFSKYSALQLHLCKEFSEEDTEKNDKDTTKEGGDEHQKPQKLNTQKVPHQKQCPVRLRRSQRGRTQKIQNQKKDSLTCEVCFKSFLGISQLKKHSLDEHKKTVVLTCAECQKVFRTKNKLEFHLLSHQFVQSHPCNHCYKKFKHKRDLDRHEKQHTDKNSKVKCKFCSRVFYRKNDLDRHIENIHPVQAPYRCDMCKAAFTSTRQLEKHKRDHKKTHPFTCWICNRGLRTAQTLKRHLLLHSDERPFSCSECSKGFNRRHDMLQHKRIHGSDRISCQWCAAKFASGDSLTKHYKRKHKDQLE